MIDHTPYIETVVDNLRNTGTPAPGTWYTQVDDDLREAGIPLTDNDNTDTLLWSETEGWQLREDDGELYDLGLSVVAAPHEVVARLYDSDRHTHLSIIGTPPSRWDDDELEENAAEVDKALTPYSS